MILSSFLDLFWKHRDRNTHPGSIVASYGHQMSPDVLFAAFDIDHVNLIIGGSEKWQTRGMDYMTPTTCVYSREMIGLFEEMKDKNIKDPAITHLIHSNFCSGDFHSMEVLKRYFNIKLIPFRMPYKITTASFNLMQKGIRDIISVFSTISGKEYEPKLLWNAIDEYNTMQELYREIATIPVTGMERLMKFMEIELAPWQEKKRLLEATVESFQEGSRESRMSRPDIILTGSPIFHGDRFMHLLERLEIPIRFFDFHFADGRSLARIPVTKGEIHQLIECDISDPVQVLAAFYLEDLCPERMVQSRKNHLEARIERIMQYQSFLSPGKRIHGVISHVLKFCDVYGTHRSKLKEIMQEMHGIPVLDLERDFSTGSTGQIRTRIEAFMELITNSRKER